MFASVWIPMLMLGAALTMLATVRVRRNGAPRAARGRVAGYERFTRSRVPRLIPRVLAPASLAVSLCCSACVGIGFPSFLGLGSSVLEELCSHDADSAVAGSGSVAADGQGLRFTRCDSLTVIVCGGTNYTPDATKGYMDPSVAPLALAIRKTEAAARVSPEVLLNTHVADYRALFDTMRVDFGTSSKAQRAMDTWATCNST